MTYAPGDIFSLKHDRWFRKDWFVLVYSVTDSTVSCFVLYDQDALDEGMIIDYTPSHLERYYERFKP